MKWRDKLLLAKPEPVYGADSLPTAAANAIQVANLELMPLEADLVNRNLMRGALGNELQLHVGAHVKMSFDVEITSSAAAGTPPHYAVLLRGSSHSETVNVDNVIYTPIDENDESVTLYLHFSGQLHAMVGARGTMDIRLNPKGIPYYHFEYTGLWVDPSSVADPAVDFSGLPTPLAVTNAHTPTFTLHGAAQKVAAYEFKQNNGVFYDNLIGEESVPVNDRKPSGSITIEAPAISTKDWFSTAKDSTVGALQWIHGLAAGRITEFNAPRVQPLRPRYTDRNGRAMIQMDLSYVAADDGSGNPEYTITER
ncbi:MAG: phage tail tube protein [Candidatus Thiodiazotropha sp.]